jgi:hypothetical protein
MKKITQLLVALTLFAVTKGTAQIYADGKNLNKLDIEYIRIAANQPNLRSPREYWILDNQGYSDLTDSTGVKIRFDKKNPDIVYNYLYKNGWELVAYETQFGHIIFRRRKN